MTQYKRNIFVWFVNDSFNSDLEKGLKTQKLMWLNLIFTVAHICKHNKQFLKHNTIFLKHKSIFVKHKPKLSKHNTKLSKHNTKLSKHNTKFSKHNTKLSKHNTKLSKHNTKLSKQHKILAGRSGKRRYESMKTRQVSNMAITHGRKTRKRGSVGRREAVCLYRMIPFTWHDKFSLQILRSLVSFSVDIRPFRWLACKFAVTLKLNRIKLKSFRVVCFVVCVPEISLSCNVITKSQVDTQILNLGADFCWH